MSRAYGGTVLACCLGLLIGAAAPAAAQLPVQQGIYVRAKLAECARNLSYPMAEQVSGTEGWIDLRFTVTADGKVQDLVINNQMGRGDFGKHTVEWMSKCEFTPARRDGKPVEARNVFHRVFFYLEKRNKGASLELVRRLRAVDDLLEQGQPEQAMSDLSEISDDSKYLYEMVHVMARRAQAMAVMNKPDIALLYLRQLHNSESHQPPREQAWVRRLALRLALVQGFYLEAKGIAEQIKDLGEKDGDDRLIKELDSLSALAASKVAIAVSGRVPAECQPEICSPERPVWRYRPIRRTISLANVQGELDSVEAQCDARTFRAKADGGVTWTIPASWGECTIEVSGKPGSTFSLVDEDI
ncbi:energy transducer TonB [Niveispirillum sp. KHB5.9]|uniref:energy transducer TonB n=1 Tax=Niveispirillum sp. KHB5.9 TaxID=3400269 RepID=UPI003A83D750